MKKLILSLLIVTGIAVVWWNKTPHTAPVANSEEMPSPEAILANDYAKIAVNLDPKNTNNDEWPKINDYSIPASELVTKANAQTFFKTAKSNLPDIYSCLKKDFCGMETRGDEDAYFDDQRTPAHILINRNLKVMKESLVEDPALASDVDWDLMQELAASNSEMLSVEALEIMREFNKEAAKTDELLKLSKHATGTTKAESLAKIAANASATDKLLIANEIEETFAGADNHTVITVLESLKKYALDSSQLPSILEKLCKYKNMASETQNWLMIKSEASKISADFERSCN